GSTGRRSHPSHTGFQARFGKLTAIAFGDLNPFPMKVLRNRRALHLQRLQAELRELERLQEEYTSENEPHKYLDLIASEDDEDA
uniref:Uncharacterized protein n=1 Tax=Electrophorus electricus TaxID=8005 RepID=A0A4W4HKR7_ELEEL